MVNINLHRLHLTQLLKAIYGDAELSNYLGFKGGTALMFFYDLPRFSVDLDFDLLDNAHTEKVYEKIHQLVQNQGDIFDEAQKHYGIIVVMDYGKTERKLKIEISNRNFGSRYELKDLFGFTVKVMRIEDMFAHKLCALTDRSVLTNRDIFDLWFLMDKKTAINRKIVETRMNLSLENQFETALHLLESKKNLHLLDGLGDLMDAELKLFIKTKLRSEIMSLLQFYHQFPITDLSAK